MAFGRYRLLSLIGEGGMGQVYRAHDTDIGRDVAIKVLPPDLSAEPGYRKRFRREALTAARLNEPHIIPIYDTGEFEGRLFLVMPVVDGIDVQALLKRDGPMNPQRAVHVIEQLAAALHAAHAVGLVHRDVKPSNALLTGRDFIYLIDFGIALDSAATKLTRTGMIVGSWAYMAPERFTTGTVESSADVYALACVLYECLTGVQPYPGNSLEQQIAGHIALDPPTPSSLNPSVPTGFDDVIARGMAKDPRQRYQSAIDLATAARNVLSTLPARNPTTERPLSDIIPPPRTATRPAATVLRPSHQPAVPPARETSSAATGPTLLNHTQPAPPPERTVFDGRAPFAPPAAGRLPTGATTPLRDGARERPPGQTGSPHTRTDPLPATDETPPPRRPRPVLKWALIAVVVVVVVVVVAGSLGAYLLRAPRTPVAKPLEGAGASLQTVAASAPTGQPTAGSSPAGQSPPAEDSNVLPFTGLNGPAGVSVDGVGNIYVADAGNNRVVELTSGSTSPIQLPFASLGDPSGIASDARGAVYVVNAGNNRLLELTPGSSSTTELSVTGLNGPRGVAVDAAGDLFITDAANRVLKLPAGSISPTMPAFTGLSGPTGVAVDAGGAVYVTDSGNNRVLRLAAGAATAAALPFTGLNNPDGVAVDPAGDVFVVDRGNDRVLKLAAGASMPIVLPITGLNSPTGAAVDASGTVYVADAGNNRVVKLAAG